MRAIVIVVLGACGGGASTEGPVASIETTECSRLGPDGTGFMIEGQYEVALDVGQGFTVVFEFPTSAATVNRSDIYSCGAWSSTGLGGDSTGCQRDPGQNAPSQPIFHSLAIEFAAPVPSPVSVTVRANPLVAPGSSATIGLSDVDTVDCP